MDQDLPIGILGPGFLGRELACGRTWPEGSFVAGRREADTPLPGVRFDWGDDSTWPTLPEIAANLALTIPPVHRELKAETDRLRRWAAWMNTHRPQQRRLVYVSTTGVYPDRPRTWSEQDTFEADSDSGRLRLATERTLAEFFDLRIVRPGGIYGSGRNLVTRILEGKPLRPGSRPVHRIHVTDLATITARTLEDSAPACLNAVDEQAETSAAVLSWVAEQPFCPDSDRLQAAADELASATPARPRGRRQRRVSNRRLVDELSFSFRYPTYRQGLAACFP